MRTIALVGRMGPAFTNTVQHVEVTAIDEFGSTYNVDSRNPHTDTEYTRTENLSRVFDTLDIVAGSGVALLAR